MNQAKCIWLTGLPCSGKTTIAKALEPYYPNCKILDGDEIRKTPLANKAGFSEEERRQHLLRMGFLAKMLVDQGITVICSFVSPIEDARRSVRALFKPGLFIEVYLSTDLQTCAHRDVKGMYALAKAGKIKSFTGVSAPYEIPESPEIKLNTKELPLQYCVDQIIALASPWPEPSSLFIGRWNGVFHNGHNYIIRRELDLGKHVTLAVRNVKPDAKNPMTAKQVKAMLEYMFARENVNVIIIPDIESVNYGRGVGYEVKQIQVDKVIAGISGTEIRSLMANNDHSWKNKA